MKIKSLFFRFQNRRTKWKKAENISNSEAAEHKLGIRKVSASDHHQSSNSSCSSQMYNNSTARTLIYLKPCSISSYENNPCSSSRSTPTENPSK